MTQRDLLVISLSLLEPHLLLALMAFITRVEPSKTVRTMIFAARAMDQRTASTTPSSSVRERILSGFDSKKRCAKNV